MYVVLSVISLIASLLATFLYFRLRNEVKNSNSLIDSSNNNDEYKEIVENLPYIYFRATMTGEIEILSNSIDGLLGYSKEEVLGQLSENFLVPGNREKFLAALKQGNGHLKEFESQMLAKGGALKWVSVNARFIYDENNEVSGTEGTIRDIADRKAVEKQLLQAKERLVRLVK